MNRKKDICSTHNSINLFIFSKGRLVAQDEKYHYVNGTSLMFHEGKFLIFPTLLILAAETKEEWT